jgi:PadR family transcriptional regulator PadR
MTLPVISILSAMLERPSDEWYGLELAERAELKSGTIYPALLRLEQAGWLASHWEEVNPTEVGRPRRRLYRLTGEGQIAAEQAVGAHLRRIGAAKRSSSPTPRLQPKARPA